MSVIRYKFEQIWGYATANVACHLCGAISKRRIREYCTINPFNTDEVGNVRSAREVHKQAQDVAEREAARQVAAGRVCRKCAPVQEGKLT